MRKACQVLVWALLGAGIASFAVPARANDVGFTPVTIEPGAEESARGVALPVGSNASDDVGSRLVRLSAIELDEVTWLARCMYSESDRPHEQELVAWVIRNRVETEYRGRTYREVVLEDKQFSAFNDPTKRREHILSLSPETPLLSWRRTLEIALDVYQAPASERPFSQTVRHFYSPISMVGGRKPHWADGDKALSSSRLGVDRRRFIFFDDVDSHLAGTEPSGASEDGGSELDNGEKGGGLTIKLRKPTGKVSRPRRPAVMRPRSDRPR